MFVFELCTSINYCIFVRRVKKEHLLHKSLSVWCLFLFSLLSNSYFYLAILKTVCVNFSNFSKRVKVYRICFANNSLIKAIPVVSFHLSSLGSTKHISDPGRLQVSSVWV